MDITRQQDPSALLDYEFDWSDYLGVDEIQESSWSVDPPIIKSLETNTLQSTKVWLTGGRSGNSYEITNRIVTTAGRIEERSFQLLIEQQ